MYYPSVVRKTLHIIVDENKNVYAELGALGNYLDMKVHESEKSPNSRTVRYHNSALLLKARNINATYVKYGYNGQGDMETFFPYTAFPLGNAPLIHEEKFYVPLDSFLQCKGTAAFYAGENDIGKQDLYVIPPQRTVLDDLVNFSRDAYSYYAFDMQKDLGVSERDMIEQYYSAEAVQYAKRLGTIFDGAAWSMSFCDDRFFDDKYVDIYMDYVLHASEEVLNAEWEKANNLIDIDALLLDVSELGVSGG